MVSPGNEIPHQYSRIISSKTSHTDIHKIQRCQSNTSSSRQYCGLNIFDENGRYSKSENGRVGQGNLGDHNYCRIPPSKLNLTADWESRNILDSSEWMLSHQIFQKVCQIRGFPEIDLFASRLSHQIPTYVAWKPDPHSHATDAFQQNWSHKLLYAFPPFCMIPKVLNKTLKEQVPKLILITPAWTTQVWYPKILNMSIKSPILLPWRKDLLKNPKGETHTLAQNRTLQLAVCAISGLDCRRREFQRQLPTLSPGQEDQILIQIMSRSGESGPAGVLEGKLIHFLVI